MRTAPKTRVTYNYDFEAGGPVRIEKFTARDFPGFMGSDNSPQAGENEA